MRRLDLLIVKDMYQNLSGYKFFSICNPESLREQLLETLKKYDLKGTIILGAEGINLNLSVNEDELADFSEELFSILDTEKFELKQSPSNTHPHKRFLVKIRDEICTIGVEALKDREISAPYIESKELKAWLDEGREFLLLDTRKAFEFEIGSFETAVNLEGIHFRDFPKEVESLAEEWKSKTVVAFCTGGIRCEKGAPLLKLKGFQSVYQLRGGILKYFEECGGAHWRGDCFVFDHRAAVRPNLEPVDHLVCRECSKDYNPQENPPEVDGLSLLCTDCFYKSKNWKRA